MLDYGATGYGLYWYCIELIASNAESRKDNPFLKHSLSVIAHNLRLERSLASEILERIIDLGIFERNEEGKIFIKDFYVIFKKTHRLPSNEWNKLRSHIFNRDDYTCQYCGIKGSKLECDHVIPVSRGGSDDINNLVTACFKCNRSKRDKLISEWVA